VRGVLVAGASLLPGLPARAAPRTPETYPARRGRAGFRRYRSRTGRRRGPTFATRAAETSSRA